MRPLQRPRADRATLEKYDPDEPRDEQGRWTDGGGSDGGGSGSGGEKPAGETSPPIDPTVANVGGDTWNQETAQRLEREFAIEKADLEKIATESPGRSVVSSEDVSQDYDEDAVVTPYEWADLSGGDQDSVQEQWKSKNQSSYYDSEVENWHESGNAKEDAQAQIVSNFNDGGEQQWALDAINDYIDERKTEGQADIPFSSQQILDAINLKYPGYGDLQVDFDDAKLQAPIGHDPDQMTLPGVEPVKPEEQLTDDMRSDLESALNTAFENEADSQVQGMSPPDYLEESANESMDNWWDQMSDEEKFDWAKDNTDIIESSATDNDGNAVSAGEALRVSDLPKKYDPLNSTSGTDYVRTQELARYMSIVRTADVMAERGVGPKITGTETGSEEWKADVKERMINVDKRLWTAWKQSSTTTDGKLLQVATAEELRGRLNPNTADLIDVPAIKKYADGQYAKIGGYDGVKAAVRAKWETTQYLLDKAGVKNLELYRGIRIKDNEVFQKLFAAMQRHYEAHEKVGPGKYEYMPTIHVERNGAASTTTDPGVANGWGGGSNRVVLRASVPRTAAISIPAYGQNIHSEREVVVAGTAWRGWDAWAGRAPTFEEIPLQKRAA